MRAGDLPDDNFPEIARAKYPGGMPATCTWTATSNTLSIAVPASVGPMWDATSISKCLWVTVTTALATGQQGFTTPATAGVYTATFTTYNGGTLLETAYPVISVAGPGLPSTMTMSTSMKTRDSVLKIAFKPSTAIPVGYATFVNNIQQDIATISVEFELYEGFDYNLGLTDKASVPCNGIAGISANLTCIFRQGSNLDVTTYPNVLTQLTYPTNPTIDINGFEAISANTQVEIHLPRIKNPKYLGYFRKMKLAVYKTSYEGLVSKTFIPTAPTAYPVATTDDASVSDAPCTGCALSNVYTDGTGTLSLYIENNGAMAVNDLFYISFPGNWFTFTGSTMTASFVTSSSTTADAHRLPWRQRDHCYCANRFHPKQRRDRPRADQQLPEPALLRLLFQRHRLHNHIQEHCLRPHHLVQDCRCDYRLLVCAEYAGRTGVELRDHCFQSEGERHQPHVQGHVQHCAESARRVDPLLHHVGGLPSAE